MTKSQTSVLEQSKTDQIPAERYAFGLFEADLKSEELRKGGRRIRIQGQPFRVLSILLEQHGEIVTREQIQRRLWDDNTTVDFDHSLGIAINKLREALGDSADNPRFIETLARRGYRFIAPVKEVSSTGQTETPGTQDALAENLAALPSETAVRPHHWPVFSLAAVALAAMIAAVWLWSREPARAAPLRISPVTQNGDVLASDLSIESFSAMAVEGGHIYFSQLENGRPMLAQALTANAEVQDLRLPSEIVAPLICDISRDGDRLIVRNHLAREPEQPLWIVPALGGQARRFGNVQAHDATWMPDGQHILYATGNALFAAQEDGQQSRQMIQLPGRAFWLRWSPDGKLLRFTILDPESGAPALWEYNADSKKATQLLKGWSQPSAECCGNWTADGKAYVFESAHDGFSDIWEMSSRQTDRDPVRLTNGPLSYQSPVAGPSPGQIFFSGIDSRREMLAYSGSARRFFPLGNNLAATALVQYSGDGEWVAWMNASDSTLWRSRADGSERLQLTTPPLSIFSMRWSPDDRTLALMARKVGEPWAIYLVDANGGSMQRAFEENSGQADPNWSVDGRSILFGRVPAVMGDESQPKAIFTLNLSTHAVEKIPGSDGLFSPRLSPNGRYIAALSASAKGLMLYEFSTQKWKSLTDSGAADPVWAGDSRLIYFQNFLETGEPIYQIDVRSGQPRRQVSLTDLQPADALDYRLITLAPGDQPVVSTQSSSVNIYSLNLK